jgi:hypothetical protein
VHRHDRGGERAASGAIGDVRADPVPLRPAVDPLQAGTVIGGSTLRMRPQVPDRTIEAMCGRSSSQRSKTSDGSVQSRPMTATFARSGMAHV